MLRAVLKFSALDLLYEDEYLAAGEMLGLRLGEWPENRSGSDSEHATALLVAGVMASRSGQIQSAIEMLTESAKYDRLTALGWLAWTYRQAGDCERVFTLTDEVLAGQIDERLRFRSLLVRVQCYAKLDRLNAALGTLNEMERVYEGQSPLLKGKFHGQRGRVLRAANESDRAIIDYTQAIHLFQESGNVQCEAITATNLAGIYLETEQFESAHRYAEQAQELFTKLGDETYQAQTWDQTAQIYLAEGKIVEAKQAIDRSIELVEDEQILKECLRTYEKIIKHSNIVQCTDSNAILRSPAPTSQAHKTLPAERGFSMTPRERASLLIENNPDGPSLLYDLIVWITSAKDEPDHEAEIDEIEEMLYAKLDDSVEHRKAYRGRRLLTSVDS